VVARGREEHLGLVLQAAKRLRVNDAVPVALEYGPDRVFGLGTHTSAAGGTTCGSGREITVFKGFELLANGRHGGRTSASLSQDVAEKARAVSQRPDAEQVGQRLAQIGERRPGPEIDAGTDRVSHHQDGHVLA
jgi:hypothetical protein